MASIWHFDRLLTCVVGCQAMEPETVAAASLRHRAVLVPVVGRPSAGGRRWCRAKRGAPKASRHYCLSLRSLARWRRRSPPPGVNEGVLIGAAALPPKRRLREHSWFMWNRVGVARASGRHP